jgi:hypothetical protein
MTTPYARPEPTQKEIEDARKLANRIAAIPRMNIVKAIVTILLENIRLAAECNEHRHARGFEPLPITKV